MLLILTSTGDELFRCADVYDLTTLNNKK